MDPNVYLLESSGNHVSPETKLNDIMHLAELCIDLLHQNEEHHAEVWRYMGVNRMASCSSNFYLFFLFSFLPTQWSQNTRSKLLTWSLCGQCAQSIRLSFPSTRFIFLYVQALAWVSDLMVEHQEIFWSLFTVDMDAALAAQLPDTWESFQLFQLLNEYLCNDSK